MNKGGAFLDDPDSDSDDGFRREETVPPRKSVGETGGEILPTRPPVGGRSRGLAGGYHDELTRNESKGRIGGLFDEFSSDEDEDPLDPNL